MYTAEWPLTRTRLHGGRIHDCEASATDLTADTHEKRRLGGCEIVTGHASARDPEMQTVRCCATQRHSTDTRATDSGRKTGRSSGRLHCPALAFGERSARWRRRADQRRIAARQQAMLGSDASARAARAIEARRSSAMRCFRLSGIDKACREYSEAATSDRGRSEK